MLIFSPRSGHERHANNWGHANTQRDNPTTITVRIIQGTWYIFTCILYKGPHNLSHPSLSGQTAFRAASSQKIATRKMTGRRSDTGKEISGGAIYTRVDRSPLHTDVHGIILIAALLAGGACPVSNESTINTCNLLVRIILTGFSKAACACLGRTTGSGTAASFTSGAKGTSRMFSSGAVDLGPVFCAVPSPTYRLMNTAST